MLTGNVTDLEIAVRMQEYFGVRRPWHRRLWGVGTRLALRELLESVETRDGSEAGQAATQHFQASLIPAVRSDLGVGDSRRRGALIRYLGPKTVIPYNSSAYHAIRAIVLDLDAHYLERWAIAIRAGTSISVERTARSIASHLFDQGFSRQELDRWLNHLLDAGTGACTLGDIVDSAHNMCQRSPTRYEALVCFRAAPRSSSAAGPLWRNGAQAIQWLRSHNFDISGLRIAGAMQFEVQAHDSFAAATQARYLAERVESRARVGDRGRLVPFDQLWLSGTRSPVTRVQERRGVEIHFLGRENRLYVTDIPPELDNAIDLFGVLDIGSPGPAVTAGWAAIESLMKDPRSGAHSACEHASAIVSAAFPRAELTQLAYAHAASASDLLANDIDRAGSNRERAQLVLGHIQRGQPLTLNTQADRLGDARLRKLLINASANLSELQLHTRATFDRLYRLRNLVAHAGKTDAVGLEAGLRTAAPLVGALADRILDACLIGRLRPLELAGRAELNLEVLGAAGSSGVHELLEV